MRRTLLVGVLLFVSGCGADGPCHNLGNNVCLTLHLAGSVAALDQISVNVTSPTGTVRTAQTGLLSPAAVLPVDLPVQLPDESGSSYVEVAGLSAAGATLARGTATVTVPPKIQLVTVSLTTTTTTTQSSRYAVSGFVTTATPSTTTSSAYRLSDNGFELDGVACSASGYCVTGGLSP
jgi:hypothetical protein